MMGWLSGQHDYVRMHVSMEFDVGVARRGSSDFNGFAWVHWETLREHPWLDEERAQIALAALHYGRILAIHKETRSELFWRVDEAARKLLSPPGWDIDARVAFFDELFDDWALDVEGRPFYIWPWRISEPRGKPLVRPKTYSSTLKADPKRGDFSIWLKMALGLERLLAPASSLISLSFVASRLFDSEQQALLGKVLLGMNEFYCPTMERRKGFCIRLFYSLA